MLTERSMHVHVCMAICVLTFYIHRLLDTATTAVTRVKMEFHYHQAAESLSLGFSIIKLLMLINMYDYNKYILKNF